MVDSTSGFATITPPPPPRVGLPLAVLAVAAAALLLVFTAQTGLGLSPDSASYVAAAHGLANGRGFVDTDGLPYVQWPPLFPTLLSTLSGAGLREIDAARFLQAALFGLVVAGFGWWIARATRTRWAGVAAGALLLVNPWVLFTFCHLLSDPLFVAWTVAFLAVSTAVLRAPSTGGVAALAAVTALGCLTRYLGVSMLVCGAGFIVILRGRTLVWKLAHLVLFGSIAALPVGVWLWRNRTCCQTLTGERFDTIDTLSGIAATIGAHVGEAFAPSKIVDLFPGPLLFVLVLAACGLLVGFWLANRWRAADDDGRWTVAGVSATFLGFYLALLAVMATISAVDPIGPRLLAPAAPPLTALVVIGLLAVTAPAGASGAPRRAAQVVVGGLALAFTLLSLSHSTDVWPRITGRDRLRRLALRTSPVMELVQRQPAGTLIVSNDPGIIYLFSGRDAGYSPRRTRYRTNQSIASRELTQLNERLDGRRRAILVWFAHQLGTDMIPPAELTGLDLVPVSQLPEATVYELRSAASR